MDIKDHAKDLAKELVGNWKSFASFYWADQPDDADDWCIVYTHNRDSGLVSISNAATIEKELESFCEDVIAQHHGSLGCGWIDGYAIRVYKTGTQETTEAFEKYTELQSAMEDYPLLDNSDYSQREYDAAIKAIENEGQRYVREDAPEDWSKKVWKHLWDNDQRELDNNDDQGACPSEESIQEALRALNLHKMKLETT